MNKKKSAKNGRKSNRHILTILFLTMFIVMAGFGIIMPILPYYAESMGASATELGMLTSLYAGLQFIFAPVWGRISDRVGRKPILLLGLIGFSLTFVGFGLSTRLWMLFASRGLSGLLTSATLPTVMAYIADTTDHENRGSGMSFLGAAMGLGMIFGPAIGGLLGAFSANTPFFVSAAMAFTIAIFAFFFLPESLSAEARASAREDKRRHGVLDIFKMLKGPLGFILILGFLLNFGLAQMESTSALFFEGKFGTDETELGVIYMVMGVVSFFTQVLLVGKAIRILGEQKLIRLSLFGVATAFVIFPLHTNLYITVAVISVMGFSSAFLRPALNTLISNRTPVSEQGVTMGVANSYYSLGRMFGPITGGIIFDHIGLSMPFFFAALITFVTFLLASFFFRQETKMQAHSIPHTAGE